nr:adenylyltransferase/cytidyltransferase family protein [uncultured Albidiferax sp.]
MISIFPENVHALAERANRTSETIGYTSGVFDLFHQGHLNYLKTCKRAVDLLVVGVDDDILVQKNKGKYRPYEQSAARLFNVQETKLVDELFIKKTSSETLIPIIRPHKYFIPSNRKISLLRARLLNDLSIELIVISYSAGVSTTAIARQRGLVSVGA